MLFRTLTPPGLDGALLAAVFVLANDALVYLTRGDVRWHPWYRWFVLSPYVIEFALLALVCAWAATILAGLPLERRHVYALALGPAALLWWSRLPTALALCITVGFGFG